MIPAPYADVLRRLQQALSNIGRSRIDVVPTPEGRQALGDAARSAIEDDLGSLPRRLMGSSRSLPNVPPRSCAGFTHPRRRLGFMRSFLERQVLQYQLVGYFCPLRAYWYCAGSLMAWSFFLISTASSGVARSEPV